MFNIGIEFVHEILMRLFLVDAQVTLSPNNSFKRIKN